VATGGGDKSGEKSKKEPIKERPNNFNNEINAARTVACRSERSWKRKSPTNEKRKKTVGRKKVVGVACCETIGCVRVARVGPTMTWTKKGNQGKKEQKNRPRSTKAEMWGRCAVHAKGIFREANWEGKVEDYLTWNPRLGKKKGVSQKKGEVNQY